VKEAIANVNPMPPGLFLQSTKACEIVLEQVHHRYIKVAQGSAASEIRSAVWAFHPPVRSIQRHLGLGLYLVRESPSNMVALAYDHELG